ncbi:MAG: hypothetical protein MZV70_23670 [Desulfobacterales bacterium]|nr:hypothetical protein [Desulfobacterales bacterium]
MRDIGFQKEITTGRYLNPFDGFEPKDIPIEERYDDTTGVASRILPYRVRPAQKPDTNAYVEKSPESICPFCPGTLRQADAQIYAGHYRGREI